MTDGQRPPSSPSPTYSALELVGAHAELRPCIMQHISKTRRSGLCPTPCCLVTLRRAAAPRCGGLQNVGLRIAVLQGVRGCDYYCTTLAPSVWLHRLLCMANEALLRTGCRTCVHVALAVHATCAQGGVIVPALLQHHEQCNATCAIQAYRATQPPPVLPRMSTLGRRRRQQRRQPSTSQPNIPASRKRRPLCIQLCIDRPQSSPRHGVGGAQVP